MSEGVSLELICKELDAIVEREDGFRFVHVGRHQSDQFSVPVEEFAVGTLPGPMVLFEFGIADPAGETINHQEALQLASMVKQSRDKLAGRAGKTNLWIPPRPEVLH